MALTKKQEALRAFAVGASEIAVLAGVSKWRTPIALYERKRGLHREEVGLPAELGTLLEEPLAKLYAERTGTERRLAKCDSLVHPEKTFALATPDRIVFPVPRVSRAKVHDLAELRDAERNVQIKSTSWRLAWQWGEPGTDAIPEEYLVQVVWEMGVTGLKHTDVAVLFDKDRFEIYQVPFNDELWQGLLELAERFVTDHLLAGVPPPPDASERYAAFLGRAFGASSGPLLHVDPGTELAELVSRYAKLKAVDKRLELHLRQASNAIKAACAEAAGLVGSFGEVKWLRKPVEKVTDYEAAYREARSLAEQLLQALPAEAQPELRQAITTIEARHQKDGRRFDQLRAKWAPELQEDVEELEVRLSRIEAGDVTTTR